ncbi:S-layer homology domain-containing protein [Peptoniphilus vaginalis]|uniref:S-layer homology domain-containing protein n=1 Tax=Peptoniphilus vaginalis TaxID=1756987 RepID=UPI0023F86B60|nr:S-layer homology domain-containing protein [Peptoniphilus vaginalis]
MKETNKIKRIVRPLCVYSLAFSLAIPSLTGIVEAATYTSTTQKLVATVAAQNEVGGGTQNAVSIPEKQENKDFTIDTVVNTETKAIKGTGKPGAKIKITDASGVIVGKEANVGKDGKWSVTIPKDKRPLKGGTEFTVTQTVNGSAPTSQTISVKETMAEENKDAANGIDFSKLKTIWTDGKNPSREDLARLLDYIKTKNPELGSKIDKVNVKSGKLQLTFTDKSKLDLTKDPEEIFKQKQDTPAAILDPIYPGAKVISGKLPEGVDKTTTIVKIKLGAREIKHDSEGFELVTVNEDGTFSYTVEGKTVPDVITVSIEEKGSDSDKCLDGMQCKDPHKEVKTQYNTQYNTQLDSAKTLVGNPDELTSEEETAVKTAVKEAMKEKNGGTDPTGVEVAVEGNNVLIKNGKGGVIGSWPVKDLIAKKVKNPEVTVNKEDKTVTARPDKDDDVANKMEVTYTPAGSEVPATIVATKGSDNKWKLPDGTDSAIKIDESTGAVTLPKEKVKEGTEVSAITKGIVSETLNPVIDSANNKTTIKPKAGDKNANKIVLTYFKPGASDANNTETLTFTKNAQGEWELPQGAPNGVTIDKTTGEIIFPDNAHSNDYNEVTAKSYGDIISDEKNGKFADWTAPQDPTMSVNEKTGKLEITPPNDADLNQIVVNYKDKDKKEATPVTLTKDEQGNWKSSDPTSDLKFENGKIVIPVDQIDLGTEVTAKAVDKAGNQSNEAKTTIKPNVPEVTSDKNSGDVSISPAERTGITEIKYTPSGKDVTEKTVIVKKNGNGIWEFDGLTGTYQEGTGYIVTDSGLVLNPNTGVVNIPKGSAKENTEVKAKSKTSTNVTSLESKTTVPDKTPPATPKVTAKDDGSIQITVPTDDTTELVINYKGKDGQSKTATLKKEQGNWLIPRNSDLELEKNTGNFLLPKDKVKAGTEVSVTAKDAAENKSDNGTATTKVPVAQAPEKPTVTVKDDGSVEVTPPKDDDVNEVVVKYLDKESGREKTVTAKKDDDGSWTVTPNDLGVTVDANGKVTVPSGKAKGGSGITATVKNKGGKDSKPHTETVKPDVPKVNADPMTGSVTITPSFNADSMEIKYTPAGDDTTEKTVVVTKGNDNKWKLPDGTTDLKLDEGSGLVTIVKGKAKENTKVTAKAKIGTTLVSKEGEATVSTSGGTTPGQATRPSKPTISDNAGTIEITPVGDVDKMEVTFTPADKDQPVTVKAKIENGTWVIEGQTPDGVSIDKGVVIIAKGKAKEGTDIKAKTIHGQEVSEEATTKVPSTTPLPNPNPQDPSENQGNDPGKISQPIIEKDNSGNTTVTPKDPNTGSVTIDIVDKDGNQRQVTAEKGKNGKWSLVNNKPEFDISGIKIDSDTGKVTIPSQILGDKGKVTASAKALSDNSYKPSYEENEIPEIKVRDHYTPTYPVYVTVPKTEKVEKAKEVPVSLETHKAYIAGYADKTLRAEGNLTRAEAAAMVTRLAGLDLSDTSTPKFKDMQKNAWYFRYINAAVKANMLDADNGMIRPNDKITRAEFAKMLAAIDKENSSVSKFDDIKGHRYEKEINKIYGNNRIEGYEDGSFRPDAYLTRAESAAFLNRMFNRIADKEAYAGLEDKLAKFKDFDASKWYYDEMVEATNSHELTRRGKASDKFGRVYEKWTRILPSDVK